MLKGRRPSAGDAGGKGDSSFDVGRACSTGEKKEEKKRQLVDCQLASLVYTAQDLLVKRNQAPESTAD